MEGYQLGGGRGNGGKGAGNKKYNWQVQNTQGKVKNSIGNGEAKELIGMTHGHELRGENAGQRWDAGWRGIKGRKQWGKYNGVINKYT